MNNKRNRVHQHHDDGPPEAVLVRLKGDNTTKYPTILATGWSMNDSEMMYTYQAHHCGDPNELVDGKTPLNEVVEQCLGCATLKPELVKIKVKVGEAMAMYARHVADQGENVSPLGAMKYLYLPDGEHNQPTAPDGLYVMFKSQTLANVVTIKNPYNIGSQGTAKLMMTKSLTADEKYDLKNLLEEMFDDMQVNLAEFDKPSQSAEAFNRQQRKAQFN